MIYRFRIVLDVLDDVFRDIEIRKTDTLEDLHNVITQAFGFEGTEMASFYKSDDEWNQGEEIVLFDVSEGRQSVRVMNETILEDIVSEKDTKLIYVYDFLNMWTFYVELADITEPTESTDYPNLLYSHGILPETPPEKNFEAEADEFEEDDESSDFENLDDFNFDDRWN